MSEKPPNNEPGQLANDAAPQQFGGYRVERLLGEGAFARVYLARAEDGRAVAIKVLREQLEPSVARQVRARFLAEQRIASAVGDERVVRVLGASAPGEDPCFLVLEFIDGTPFCVGFRRAQQIEGPPEQERDWQVLARLGHELASALKAAHARGVVHRDLKPDNVLVTRSERDGRLGVKLVDFGIAKAPPHVVSSMRATITPHRTELGTVMGSQPYMAPEQNGLSHAVTGKADVYALGVMLLITALGLDNEELEFERTSFALPGDFERALGKGPEIPRAFRDLLARMTATDPDERPDMPEVALTLQRLAQPNHEFAEAVQAFVLRGELPNRSAIARFLREFERTDTLTADERAFLAQAPAELLSRRRVPAALALALAAPVCVAAGAFAAHRYELSRYDALAAQAQRERDGAKARLHELELTVRAQTPESALRLTRAETHPRTTEHPCETTVREVHVADSGCRATRESLTECNELNKQADVRAETLRSEIDSAQRAADEHAQAEARCRRDLDESANRLRLCNDSLHARSPAAPSSAPSDDPAPTAQ